MADQLTDSMGKLRDALPQGNGYVPGQGLQAHGSTSDFTVYGPKIDPKGSAFYDKDSFNGIGHIQGKRYSLQTGDSAMKYDYATSHYHIKPGERYISDKDHKWHTWKDTTGSRNPENEDIYKGAQINVTNNFAVHALVIMGWIMF